MATMAEKIRHYLRGRDLLDTLKKQHKEAEGRIQAVLDKLEADFLADLNAQGLQRLAAPAGTVYKTEQMRASVADWPLLLDWIKSNEKWDYLERRVSKTAVEEGVQSAQILPPGVNVSRAFTVNVRRS